MSLIQGRGSFINGEFIKGDGPDLLSTNPAKNYEPIFQTGTAISAN